MKAKSLIPSLVLVFMVCITCTAADSAWQDGLRTDYVNLPVYFVTDRDINLFSDKGKYSYGKQIVNSDSGTSALTFGIEQHRARLKDDYDKPVSTMVEAFQSDLFGDRFNRRGLKWRTFSGLVYGHLFQWQQRDRFYSYIEGALAKCPTRELVVFVHGCCVDHKKACKQAVNIQKWYQRPVLLYDWGTNSKNYYQSLVSFPRTQSRFDSFIDDLKDRYPDTKITIVAYSVGANILKDYCMNRTAAKSDSDRRFDNMIVLRADTNIGVLEEAIPHLVSESKNPVQIWVASNDSQMIASRLLRLAKKLPSAIIPIRGPRAGETMAWQENEFERVQVLDVSALGLGHEIPYRLLPLCARTALKEGDIGAYSVNQLKKNVYSAIRR